MCADVAACVWIKTHYISKRADLKWWRHTALSFLTMHDSSSCNVPAGRRAQSASFADKGAVGVCISSLGMKAPRRRKYLSKWMSRQRFLTS